MADPRQDIDQIIYQLRELLSALLFAARATTDDTKILKIHTEYAAADTCLNQAIQAQISADDQIFDKLVIGVKFQAENLKTTETRIKEIIADVAVAAKVIGLIAGVASMAAGL